MEPFIGPIRVAKGVYGNGVYATRVIAEGEVFEVAPVVKIREHERRRGYRHLWSVFAYSYSWSDPEDPTVETALALGYGGVYNHSEAPNVKYRQDEDGEDNLVLYAVREVAAGEELTHDYGAGWSPDDFRWGPAPRSGEELEERRARSEAARKERRRAERGARRSGR